MLIVKIKFKMRAVFGRELTVLILNLLMNYFNKNFSF